MMNWHSGSFLKYDEMALMILSDLPLVVFCTTEVKKVKIIPQDP